MEEYYSLHGFVVESYYSTNPKLDGKDINQYINSIELCEN
jgi:hypothetical protein